jgi:hypothetical protein
MHHNKSHRIADSLQLDYDDFNKLIDCDLSGKEYFKKLASNLK